MKEWSIKLIDGNRDELENDDYLYRLGLDDKEEGQFYFVDDTIEQTTASLPSHSSVTVVYDRYRNEWVYENNNYPPLQERPENIAPLDLKIERVVETVKEYLTSDNISYDPTLNYRVMYRVNGKIFEDLKDAHAYVLNKKYSECIEDIDPKLKTQRNTKMIFELIKFKIMNVYSENRKRRHDDRIFMNIIERYLTEWKHYGYIDAWRFLQNLESFGYSLQLRRGDQVIKYDLADMW